MRRITEHKRLVSKTEWAVTTCNPMDDNDIVLNVTSGDLLGPEFVSMCVHVCGEGLRVVCVMSDGVLDEQKSKNHRSLLEF